jgi:type IV secretion system protein VirD4
LLGIAGVALAWWQKQRRHRVTDSYGSATVASVGQMDKGGLLAEGGVILGRCLPDRPRLAEGVRSLLSPAVSSDTAARTFFAATYNKRWLSERLICVNDHVHIATFSPTGGGKGVGVLIPNLLSCKHNCVIVDPKGENYRAVSRHRKRKFGKRQIRLDPFGVCGPGGDCLNPYDFIRPDDKDFLDQCRDFAQPIIIRGQEEKPHFNDYAELNLIALTAWVCGCEKDPNRRHLGIVRGIASSRDVYSQAVRIMQQTDACQGIIRKLGGQIAFPAEEEQASVLSTFTRQTAFLDSPAVIESVKRSTFDPMEVKTGNADLWLILPEERLVSLQRLQRLWLTTVMGRMTRGALDESRKVLWFLEEFAHIGSMPAIEEAVTLKRGRGMRLWFIFQDTNQLKTCFGDKAATILGNIGTQQYFGINSYETAEEISKRIGDMTQPIESENDTTGDSRPTGGGAHQQSGSRSSSRSVTRSEIARRLLKPEEILTMDKNVCIIFHKNLPVCLGRLVRYFEAPEFRRRWFGFGARGTARPRGLGLAGVIAAAVTLATSAFIAAGALMLAGVPFSFPVAAPGGSQDVRTELIPPLISPTDRPSPRWQLPPRHRSGESGFLIPIE